MKPPPPPLFTRHGARNRARYILAALALLAIVRATAEAVFTGPAT